MQHSEASVHSRFRGSVICGAPSMENRFQVAKFLFKVRKASSLFCLVQNGPGVTWIAYIGLKEHSKWSLGCAGAFLEAFFDLFNTCNTQSQQAVPKEFQNNHGKWIVMLKTSWPRWPHHFQNFHILTDSVKQAKLDIVHCCQLHWWTSCVWFLLW